LLKGRKCSKGGKSAEKEGRYSCGAEQRQKRTRPFYLLLFIFASPEGLFISSVGLGKLIEKMMSSFP